LNTKEAIEQIDVAIELAQAAVDGDFAPGSSGARTSALSGPARRPTSLSWTIR